MTAVHEASTVFVEAPARLHFGMLDLRGDLGRRFGGLGAAIPTPSLLLEASRAPGLEAEGPSCERALDFARRYAEHEALAGGARLQVHRAIPAHAGLGSGTQLALAVARALAELYGRSTDPLTLTRAVGRAGRSAVGTWTFALGGFVVDGGRRLTGDEPAPVLARYAIPEAWRVVVAVPQGEPGVSGDAEAEAFAHLPLPSARDVEHVAHLVLMGILPALVEGDVVTFGHALSDVQCVTGRWFAAAQGGTFAPGAGAELVQRMSDWGAAGVGQSSWGPAVYGIVAGDRAAAELAARVRDSLAPADVVYAGRFANAGARVWRTPTPSR